MIASDQIDFGLLLRFRNAAIFVEKADYAPDAPAVAIENHGLKPHLDTDQVLVGFAIEHWYASLERFREQLEDAGSVRVVDGALCLFDRPAPERVRRLTGLRAFAQRPGAGIGERLRLRRQ